MEINLNGQKLNYHYLHGYASREIITPTEMFPKFLSVIHVIHILCVAKHVQTLHDSWPGQYKMQAAERRPSAKFADWVQTEDKTYRADTKWLEVKQTQTNKQTFHVHELNLDSHKGT